MTPLQTELQSEAYAGLTAAEALARLNEQVEVSSDATPYTWSGTNEKLNEAGVPADVVAGWDTAILALPGGSMLDRMLSSGGVNYTLPNVRGALQAVLDSSPAEPIPTVINALLNIGVQVGSRWQLSQGTQPTINEVAETQLWLQMQQRAINATALLLGRIAVGDSEAALANKWSMAWFDAGE